MSSSAVDVGADARAWVRACTATLYEVTSTTIQSLEEAALSVGVSMNTSSIASGDSYRYIVALRDDKENVVAVLGVYRNDCSCVAPYGTSFECIYSYEDDEDNTDLVSTTISIDVKPAFLIKCVKALPRNCTFSIGDLREHISEVDWVRHGVTCGQADPSKLCPMGYNHACFPECRSVM